MVSGRGASTTGVILLIMFCLLGADTASAQSGSTPWSDPVDVVRGSGADSGVFGVLLCDVYQTTHLFWSNMTDNGSAIYYQNDVGDAWSTPIDVISTDDPVLIRLHAGVSSASDSIHLIWQNRYISGDVFYSRSALRDASSARSWSNPFMLAANVDGADLSVDTSGALHVVYGESDDAGLQNAIYYIHSEDDGRNWSQPLQVFGTVSRLPSTVSAAVAVDTVRRIHLGITLRSQDYGVYSEVGYLRSPDGGAYWEPYRTIQTMGTTFQGVATITPYVFDDGEVHLTWHDPRRMHQWSSNGGETWSSPVEIMPLGAGFGGPNALAKDSAGVVHAVLAMTGAVFSVAWDGLAWGVPDKIDGRPLDPHGQHIAVCQGNQLHVVYYDRLEPVTVWYSHSQTDAPHKDRQALLTTEAEDVPAEAMSAPSQALPAGAPDVGADLLVPPLEGPSSTATVPILIAVASGLAVTTAAMVIGLLRRR